MERASPGRDKVNKSSSRGFEVSIWCTVQTENEDDARQIVYEYCQHLKQLFAGRLSVRAVEVGLPSF